MAAWVPPAARGPRLCKAGPGGHCLSFRGGIDLDKIARPCPAVPGEHLMAGSLLGVDELVQCDRAVGEISPGQIRALLEPLEFVLDLRDQGDCYPPANCLRLCDVLGLADGHGVITSSVSAPANALTTDCILC